MHRNRVLAAVMETDFYTNDYDGYSNYFPEFHDDRNNSIDFRVVVNLVFGAAAETLLTQTNRNHVQKKCVE